MEIQFYYYTMVYHIEKIYTIRLDSNQRFAPNHGLVVLFIVVSEFAYVQSHIGGQ